MSEPALSIRDLAKEYRLGAAPAAYGTLRDALGGALRRGGGERQARDSRTLWALDGVSFDVEQGTALGVIGSNGAGKTTLLKILSRITKPSRGEAVVRGRVGSLLEVGTGFHPELTGRENIFMNGAILGMRRAEIAAKLDEIIAFAEVERFVDTPVKRYSSGMYVRLAFAVAAHLESDILLVDEVLAVGDLAFQRKCLGKMRDQTSNEGRTVLFVSHNLASVKALTEQCVWLDRGKLRTLGPTDEVFRQYVLAHAAGDGAGRVDLSDPDVGRPPRKPLGRQVTFESVELRAPDGTVTDAHLEREPVAITVQLRCHRPLDEEFELLARVRTLDDTVVFSAFGGRSHLTLQPGLFSTQLAIDPNPLRPGTYQLELYCLTRVAQDLLPAAISFRIESNLAPGDDPRSSGGSEYGLVRTPFRWSPLAPAGPGGAAGQERP